MPDAKISELPAAASIYDTDLAPLVQSDSAGPVTRRATMAQLRSSTLADRSLHVRDFGAKGDGVADDAPAIQAAVNAIAAQGGGRLEFGPHSYRLASAITISNTAVQLQGAGFNEGASTGIGTWLVIDSTGFVPFTFNGQGARGAAVRDIAIRQVHTAIQDATWTPTNYDYVFRITDCYGGVDFDNVFLYAVNRGIYCRNSGRLDIRRLRGQVFTCGVEIDECYDVPRLHNLHFWPFWNSNANIMRWQQTNGDAVLFRRCDGPFIDQVFALGYRSMLRFSSSTAGITAKFYIGQAYADFCQYGIWVDGNGTEGQIANLTTQGEKYAANGEPLTGSYGIYVNASNTRIQAANLRIDRVQDHAIRIEQSGNRLDIAALRCVYFNTRNTNAPAIYLANVASGTANEVNLGSAPLLEAITPGPLVNTDSNGLAALHPPSGSAARPGLALGGADTGLFTPETGAIALTAGGAELLRANQAGMLTLGGTYNGHALEVTKTTGALNRLNISGAAAGKAVVLSPTGSDANIAMALLPKGTGAITAASPDGAASGGNARGSYAMDLQRLRNASTHVASGYAATIAGGEGNTASANHATIAGGLNNTASGTYSRAGGFTCQSSGPSSVAEGSRSVASGWYSRASGRSANDRGRFGADVFASSEATAMASGEAQAGRHVMHRVSTSATPVMLTTSGGAVDTANIINLPDYGLYQMQIAVVAEQSGGTSGTRGDSAAWILQVTMRRRSGAGSAAILGILAIGTANTSPAAGAAMAPLHTDAAAAGWRISVAADTANGGLALTATGEANKTINWVAQITSTEVVG